MNLTNPFLTEGYLSPEYFCDRKEETALLDRDLITQEKGTYEVYDRFFSLWLKEYKA